MVVRSSTFYGIESGSGRIAGRRIDVETMERRRTGARTVATLWLPAVDGELRLVNQDELDQASSSGQASVTGPGFVPARRVASH